MGLELVYRTGQTPIDDDEKEGLLIPAIATRAELKKLLDDVTYWVDHNTYNPDEIAVRLKHRIVSIHCFPNGNGRHSRLMADIIIEKVFKQPVFNWGAGSVTPDLRQIQKNTNSYFLFLFYSLSGGV
jgi:fido (protein-threonine AMPylation protein)